VRRSTEVLLREIGFDVATSSVECCGMAGSFWLQEGLLRSQHGSGGGLDSTGVAAEKDGGPRPLIASGHSCTSSFRSGLNAWCNTRWNCYGGAENLIRDADA